VAGAGLRQVPAGSLCEARFEAPGGGDDEQVEESIHRQRHFPEADVLAAFERAELECVGVYGHDLDGIPRQPLDPAIHTKAIYIARRGKGVKIDEAQHNGNGLPARHH
jgi:hypothetical protein